MGKLAKKPKTFNGKKSRKTVRKEKRKEKKQRKQDYYVNRVKPGQFVMSPGKNNTVTDVSASKKNATNKKEALEKKGKKTVPEIDQRTKDIQNEKRKQQKLEKEMQKRRRKQLQEANEEEDKVIKRLEKDLKLNKRKSKSIPKSFETDGLDYLLEMCDPENMKNVVSSEQQFNDGNDGFEEDFAMITRKSKPKSEDNASENDSEEENDSFFISEKKEMNKKSSKKNVDSEEEMDSEEMDFDVDSEEDAPEKRPSKNSKNNKKGSKKQMEAEMDSEDEMDFDEEDSEEDVPKEKASKKSNKTVKFDLQEDESDSEEEMDFGSDSEEETIKDNPNKRKMNDKTIGKSKQSKKQKTSDSEASNLSNSDESGSDEETPKEPDTWEDIYGRKRSKDGLVLENTLGKYIPPALRAQNDSKRAEKLTRLKKQLKGLLNRLAESNMHSIATQIEDLYMNNSRNDMNETLTQLIFDSLISTVKTPERLLLEHVMLISILHANVGTEVGANFLLNVVKKFDELLRLDEEVENKQLDNTVHIIAQLYNFKVFHAQLLYQILAELSKKFEEKHVECILLVLKNVGFSLRKDDPLALKNIILDLQKKATTVPDDNSRVKFMLDILLAIKNNNVTKIPNYDTTYSEHLKKLLKGFIRKGNYVTQLNISLEDLLKADERGKWWVVGSAWTGMEDKKVVKENEKTERATYSKKLLDLARKQRMNTDTRRNIFCIIMTAEDYLDAFEKLLHLGLKNQQEREIIHVILHCCLQEKSFNPYYGVLAQKFCEYDRKYQMTVRCSIWDKLKALTDCSGAQLSNMAKMLAHLFINQGLPISTLKVIEFGELDKITLRFMRQVLLGVLLHQDEEACLQVFSRVATSPKLKMFRDSLRLFIHHFLLRNLKDGVIEEEQKEMLIRRAQMVEKGLGNTENKNQLV